MTFIVMALITDALTAAIRTFAPVCSKTPRPVSTTDRSELVIEPSSAFAVRRTAHFDRRHWRWAKESVRISGSSKVEVGLSTQSFCQDLVGENGFTGSCL